MHQQAADLSRGALQGSPKRPVPVRTAGTSDEGKRHTHGGSFGITGFNRQRPSRARAAVRTSSPVAPSERELRTPPEPWAKRSTVWGRP